MFCGKQKIQASTLAWEAEEFGKQSQLENNVDRQASISGKQIPRISIQSWET
jgi:hypothetical protein